MTPFPFFETVIALARFFFRDFFSNGALLAGLFTTEKQNKMSLAIREW